ncbi:hypothetical protein ACS0TY_011289 [Phlomoides rotata]
MSNDTRKNSGRKRFNDDQIKSLETTFESESRPELHLKQHLANRLGLHPQQIAIWFQNKRARSKSKQVETQFTILKAKYHNLASQLDTLRKENQNLVIQVETLRKMSEENEMRLGSSENRGVVIDMESKEENKKAEEEAAVFDIPEFAEDECFTFLDNSGNWWEF